MTREAAFDSARRVAAHLKERHGATRVLLFGSLAHGSFLPGRSDIDLYFEGLPYGSECFVVGDTDFAFPTLALDLMGDGHASEALRREVSATGIAL